MPIREIRDVDDPRLGAFRALRGRESSEVLWAEGLTVVERLLTSGLRPHAVLANPAMQARIAHLDEDTDVYVAEQQVLDAVVGFHLHRGIIAVADRPATRTPDTVISAARTLVVLEGVNDPENLGAIARSARALGADGLLLDSTCADPYYRRSVRVSMGEILHLPIARAPIADLLDAIDDAGLTAWALTPRPEAVAIGRLSVPQRLALVFGAEGPGLTSKVLGRLTPVRIPIHDGVDSLNVGHAVAVALGIVQLRRS